MFDVKFHWMLVKTCLLEPMYDISAIICDKSFTIVGYSGADYKCYNGTFMIAANDIIPVLLENTTPNGMKWLLLHTGE